MKLFKSTLALAVMAFGLSACATGQHEPETLYQKLEARNFVLDQPVNRIRYHRINGWSEVDNWHVIINAGVSDHYLLTLRNSCRDLDTSMDIGFSSTVGALTTADKLIVKGPGGFVDYCYISTITRLKKVERTS